MRFLVTNDDGYRSPGINMLARILGEIGDVVVVAPDEEMSATSHSLTLTRPLRVNRRQKGIYTIDGTPTDCVMLAVNGLISERPDYVCSGINHGANLGDDVTYSGTVAAAIEGTLLGIPSLAISYASRDPRFMAGWEETLRSILAQITSQRMPEDTLLNLNLPAIPATESRGVKVTTLGKRTYQDAVTSKEDQRGQVFYWIGGQEIQWKGNHSSDFMATREGYVSITPLHLDLTNYRALEELNAWDLSLRKEEI